MPVTNVGGRWSSGDLEIYDTGSGTTLATFSATDDALSAAAMVLTTLKLGIGASTAAAGSSTSDAGALPAATAVVYPTTAADGTKGVKIHADDKVTGRVLFIGNGVSNAILKIYAPTGGAINGASADAAYSTVSGKGALIVCLSSSGNTWLALG